MCNLWKHRIVITWFLLRERESIKVGFPKFWLSNIFVEEVIEVDELDKGNTYMDYKAAGHMSTIKYFFYFPRYTMLSRKNVNH